MKKSGDIKDTALFKKMLKHMDEWEEDREEFNQKYVDLINKDTTNMGFFLKCHLIIEYFLDDYIKTCNPAICNYDKLRLSFNQKLDLANHPETIIKIAMPALKCLNTARNKFSHNINTTQNDLELKPIESHVDIWRKAAGESTLKGIKAVEYFTIRICSHFSGVTKNIERHTPGKGLIAYNDQWKEDYEKIKNESGES
jgi:hypothetical protein